MTLIQPSQTIRLSLLAGTLLALVAGFFVTADLGQRHEQALVSHIDADSSGVASLLQSRLAASQDPTELLKLGYHLAAADQCDLATTVLNRAEAITTSYRDNALLNGWCQLNLAQKTQLPVDQSQHLARARQLIDQGRLVDPLDPFGQSLDHELAKIELQTP